MEPQNAVLAVWHDIHTLALTPARPLARATRHTIHFGRALETKLQRDGIKTIGDLRRVEEVLLHRRYGAIGQRLYKLSRGIDGREVDPSGQAKSISSETTFATDIADLAALAREIWPLCESVSRRLKKKQLAGKRVALKLETADFRILTRSRTLSAPVWHAEEIYRATMPMLEKEADGRPFRLIGAGVEELCDANTAAQPDLLDPGAQKRVAVENAIEVLNGWSPDGRSARATVTKRVVLSDES